ncbi:E3 ubiquitin-protein ligase NEURL1-like isoform X1 [Anguilla anguilla]|uniref:E3 ubiquitin-protein ligase NEURL1-like isoform X1 n=1 Tax=Anguilla anguilla TaxID=7936 RepID=UPI0015B23E77|nr:E3 ubiquitin-protein ligase NEURL1-like isoform X1 [Anguilla anguilla]
MGNTLSSIPTLQRRRHHHRFGTFPNFKTGTLGGPFPVPSHRCRHKPKRCLSSGPALPASPLLFHPSAKGSQIVMDLSQRAVKRQASFCNAITFSNRPVAVHEQVKLKITKKQPCWSGALRLGFTSKDPSRIHPDSLPKYACPDLVSQTGFWGKALPEEFASEGNVVAFWVDKKGRVFYRVNGSAAMLFFSGVHTAGPLWAMIDVYGLTRGVLLLGSEVMQPSCLRPRPFGTVRMSSLRRERDESRLSISLCDLSAEEEEERLRPAPSSCPVPQNSLNSQRCSLLPPRLDGDLRFHPLHGAHVVPVDPRTVARSPERGREDRTLAFTERPLCAAESVFVKVTVGPGPARPGSLSYGVTTCDPGDLRPGDLPCSPESLVDRKEFWAVCRVPVALHSGDVLGFTVNAEGEVALSHNGRNAGMQVCVDNSRPLWMFFGLHGAVTQLRILGSAQLGDPRGPSGPGTPSSTPGTPTGTCRGSGAFDPALSGSCPGALCGSADGLTPSSPTGLPESSTFPSAPGSWSDECTICYENAVDAVIYSCGHMCLCYTCGLKLKGMPRPCCPICRRAVKDIIKTYRSS